VERNFAALLIPRSLSLPRSLSPVHALLCALAHSARALCDSLPEPSSPAARSPKAGNAPPSPPRSLRLSRLFSHSCTRTPYVCTRGTGRGAPRRACWPRHCARQRRCGTHDTPFRRRRPPFRPGQLHRRQTPRPRRRRPRVKPAESRPRLSRSTGPLLARALACVHARAVAFPFRPRLQDSSVVCLFVLNNNLHPKLYTLNQADARFRLRGLHAHAFYHEAKGACLHGPGCMATWDGRQLLRLACPWRLFQT
jgi:hypothetical protein